MVFTGFLDAMNAHKLLIGFINIYDNLPEDELKVKMAKPKYHYPGLKGSLESLEWLWDTGFAAVAGDNPGFEAWCKHARNLVYRPQKTDWRQLQDLSHLRMSSGCMRPCCRDLGNQSVNFSIWMTWQGSVRNTVGGAFS